MNHRTFSITFVEYCLFVVEISEDDAVVVLFSIGNEEKDGGERLFHFLHVQFLSVIVVVVEIPHRVRFVSHASIDRELRSYQVDHQDEKTSIFR